MGAEALYADELVSRARAAALAFDQFDQAGVDRIVDAVYRAAFDARIRLAEAAFEETGIGVLKDKVLKNAFASLIVYRDIKKAKTVGVIDHDPKQGIMEVARPIGPVLSLTPVTNPTSTVINKALICLKTRNPVIFSPHKAARKCSRLAAELLYEAAMDAGAPEGCIQWSTKSKWSYTESLMTHHGIALVLATTAFHFVREAFKSGNPVLGAGEGNVPVYVDETADLDFTARSIVESKTFDHGTVCCSEQALAVTGGKDQALRKAFEKYGGRFLSEDEVLALGRTAFDPDRKVMRSDVVGQSACAIAKKAGIEVPQGTRLLIAPVERVGPDEPLSHEILAPILAYYVATDREAALKICCEINRFHGKGHTLSMYTGDESQGEAISNLIQSGRILINTPSSLGGLGGTLNRIHPSLTLSCGTAGKNYLTDNITVQHLLNINRIALPRPDAVWQKIPDPAWLDPEFDSRSIDALP